MATLGERRREVMRRLEEGTRAMRESDRFREWLDVCARFHRYSPNNTMLIWLQRPDATQVMGFHGWRKLGRWVKAGEKGIQILAPQPYKREDEDGEEVEAIYFKPVYVFDIAQTDGKPLPEIAHELAGGDAGLWDQLAAIARGERLTITTGEEGIDGTASGWYARERAAIWVDGRMAGAMRAKTLAHELAHHFGEHHKNGHGPEAREMIAEAAAYVVLAHFGIDAGQYSFGYLASWTDDKTFRAGMGDALKAAGAIIDRLEAKAKAAA